MPSMGEARAGLEVPGQRLEEYSLTGAEDGANPEVGVSEETGDEFQAVGWGDDESGGGRELRGPSKVNKGLGKWSRVSETRRREVRGTKTRGHR